MLIHTFPVLPSAKPTKSSKAPRKTNAKYDHFAILQDKINGMSWADIVVKYKYKGDKQSLRQLCLNSMACRNLTPKEFSKIGIDWHINSKGLS